MAVTQIMYVSIIFCMTKNFHVSHTQKKIPMVKSTLELAEAKPEMECYWYKSENYLFDEKKYFTNLRSIQKAL